MADKLNLLIKRPTQADGALGATGQRDVRQLTPDWQLEATSGAALNAGEAWDVAYATAEKQKVFAEPDFDQPWSDTKVATVRRPDLLGARPGEQGSYQDQDSGFPKGPGFAWHLGKNYTQLSAAQAAIEALGDQRALVRIGMIDVGFDFRHQALPQPPLLRLDLQRNFAKDRGPDDASDPYVEGKLRNPGHGTGTLSILAGRKLAGMQQAQQNGIVLGGNPFAEIIPCRIGPSVLLAKTSAFVHAVQYLMAPNNDVSLRADVISMSMGGFASEAWADVVNQAYEAGIVIVTAAGNNFGAPKAIVFPARFNRVLAACGVMANGSPYVAGLGTMSAILAPKAR